MLHAPVSWFGCGSLQHSGPIGTDWVKDTGHFGGVRYTLANNLWWVLNRKWFRVMLSVGSSNNTLMPPSFFGIFFVRQLSISFSERAYQLGQVGPTWAIQGYHITQPKMDYTHPKKKQKKQNKKMESLSCCRRRRPASRRNEEKNIWPETSNLWAFIEKL